MNVGLHDRGVDTQLLAIFQPASNRRLHHQFIDGRERLRSQPDKGAVERIVLGHRLAIEIGEPAQRVSVGDPFAQFAIIPVLDTHEDQRAQHLLRRQPVAAGVGPLQTPSQIAAYRLDHLFVVGNKIGDGLQQRLQNQPLLQQLQIGKTDLWIGGSRHFSALVCS